jgi:excisionase family DNA binding protein
MKKPEKSAAYPIQVRLVRDGWIQVSQPDLGIVVIKKNISEIKKAHEIGDMVLEVLNKTLKMTQESKEPLPMPRVPSSGLIGTEEAAAMLGVSASTLRRLCDKGDLPFMKRKSGHRRINIQDLVGFEPKLYIQHRSKAAAS